jgi:23S rRNA (uracil1939-C5)-methyltransferase
VFEGRVRDVTQAGESVVETSSGIVLADRGLPGERVRVAVEGRRAGVLRGKVLSILEHSPERVTAGCALVDRCGGCPLMSLEGAAQLRLKVQRASHAIEGLCRPGVAVQVERPGPALGYRRRVRFAFRRSGKRMVLGYRAQGSHAVIDVAACPVLEPALQQALECVRSVLLETLAGSGELELTKSEPDAVTVQVRCDEPVSPAAYRAAEGLASRPEILGVSLRVEGGAPALFGQVEQVSMAPDGLALSAPASSFAQANTAVNSRLVELVVELAAAQGARVLELYAGHGNLTVALARHAAALTAFELDAPAAEACRANLRTRGLANVRVQATDAADASKHPGPADVLVLDPPRGGAPALASITLRTKPARVVYVSCHMTTLGRDLRALAEQGYRVDRAHVLDMFPQTAHVEAVVRMQLESYAPSPVAATC